MSAGAPASRPAAFTAVYLTMAAVALVGAWIAGRLRPSARAEG
ncbi:hypothetical protein [Streptomyces sp. NPDC048845]